MECFSKQNHSTGGTIEEKDNYWWEVKEKKDNIKLEEANHQDYHINMKNTNILRKDQKQKENHVSKQRLLRKAKKVRQKLEVAEDRKTKR